MIGQQLTMQLPMWIVITGRRHPIILASFCRVVKSRLTSEHSHRRTLIIMLLANSDYFFQISWMHTTPWRPCVLSAAAKVTEMMTSILLQTDRSNDSQKSRRKRKRRIFKIVPLESR